MLRRCLVLSALLLLVGTFAFAQLDPSAGILPFSTQAGGQYDSIDLASSNILLVIPILKKNGKIPFSYQLVGNFHAYPFNYGEGTEYLVSAGILGGGLSGLLLRRT